MIIAEPTLTNTERAFLRHAARGQDASRPPREAKPASRLELRRTREALRHQTGQSRIRSQGTPEFNKDVLSLTHPGILRPRARQ